MDGMFSSGPGRSTPIEEQFRENLSNRVIVINEQIDECSLENVSLYILKWNREDINLPKEKRKPIWIYINTIGGDVDEGFNLIDVITSSETPIYTVCFSLCASMGFHIFIAGHKRYAFKNSVLLIHDGAVSISNSSSKAKDTMEFFNKVEERTKDHVLTYTNITSEFYDKIYEKEYYIHANEQGKNLGCVDFIIGEDTKLADIL